MSKERVEELEKEIECLHQRWPAHSVPPALMEQLDTLETDYFPSFGCARQYLM